MDWESLTGELKEKRILGILSTADEYGWTPKPITLAVRFNKPSCMPFYMSWNLNQETMRWTFGESRIIEWVGTPPTWPHLNLKHIALYLMNPTALAGVDEKKKPIWGE